VPFEGSLGILGLASSHRVNERTVKMDDAASRNDGSSTTKLSGRSVKDTVARLQELIEKNGMRIFDVIDQSEEAQLVGMSLRETVLVLFGSPAAGTPVMEAAPLAALDLPLRILIWDDDKQTKVSYVPPQVLAARYGLGPDLVQRIGGIDPLTDALIAP
jgi:uncharacterized protein (DUF302 family)